MINKYFLLKDIHNFIYEIFFILYLINVWNRKQDCQDNKSLFKLL